MKGSRREFLSNTALLLAAASAGVALAPARDASALILPPTAGELETFLNRCIRCFRCVEACTAGCIRISGSEEGAERAFLPYLEPRTRACIVCMDCTKVCPTDALVPVEREAEAILAGVEMGKAAVNEALCLSFLGRVCGVCHDACPFPSDAISLGSWARPEVLQGCMGCGRCEERCPQVPTAIKVFPGGGDGRSWVGPRPDGRERR